MKLMPILSVMLIVLSAGCGRGNPALSTGTSYWSNSSLQPSVDPDVRAMSEDLASRYGLRLGRLALPNGGQEGRDWTLPELQEVEKALKKLPMNFLRGIELPQGIGRIAQLSLNPGQSAGAFAITTERYIGLADLTFTVGSSEIRQYENSVAAQSRKVSPAQVILTHEIGHAWMNSQLDSREFEQWSRLSGWQYQGKTLSWNDFRKGVKPVLIDHDSAISQYATRTPGEDFAESVAAAIFIPETLKARSPERYGFIQQIVLKTR